MKYLLIPVGFLLSCFSFALHAYGQTNTSVQPHDSIYTYVEQMPEPGVDITAYLSNHLHYPDSAADHNIQGRVILKFVVNEDGSLSDCRVERGIGGGCDKAALDVLKNMPKWKAGIHNGQPVKVLTMLPVTFTLSEKKRVPRPVYSSIDQPPYPEYSVSNYFKDNFQCKESFDDGVVRFVVNEDGSISDPSIVSGVDAGCRSEVYRVLKSMPKWKPGKQSGQPARVYSSIRIRYYRLTGNVEVEKI